MADQSSIVRRRPLAPTFLSQHEVLRPRECDVVRDQVLSLRQYWKSRSSYGQFFTLGVASYLDAVEGHDAYLQEARGTNQILLAHYDWLFERIKRGFEDLLGRPVSYCEAFALSGFHIFVHKGANETNDRPSSRAHFDMQWVHAMPGQRPEQTLSFTLPIEEPLGGCSLEIWPVHADMVPPGFDALKYAASVPSQTLQYARGQMVVHDGLLLHAIGRASIARPNGYRITLQGHGVRVFGGWKLYW
jgi:hypothetical protein